MSGWKIFLADKECCKAAEDLKALASMNFDKYQVYADSIHLLSDTLFFIARDSGIKTLIIAGNDPSASLFSGRIAEYGSLAVKLCPLDVQNSRVLFDVFPFTRPVSCKGRPLTAGLGDRLGLASPGHLRAIKKYDVFPVLAQQSIRELNLTGRTYEEILACAAWAVFQEGFKNGYGADGDHLKNRDEIIYALRCGFTRITLDCSEHIQNSVLSLSDDEINSRYMLLTQADRERYESTYLNRSISLDSTVALHYSLYVFKKMVLLYHDAVKFIISVYREFIEPFKDSLDFEISIDETLTETSPEDHFFTASELIEASVVFDALAPRFCGKFEKGIDYKGDLKQFDDTLEVHSKIAQKLGYRLSIHSGSDKFSAFPFIGKRTNGIYHIKTAGTHWLEAVRVIARHAPELYRRMHHFALEHINEAKKYYSISADMTLIPDIDQISDSQLPDYLEIEHSRQLLHITYGEILAAKHDDGSYLFRDEIYRFLDRHELHYAAALESHLGRHLEALGAPKLQE